MMDTIIGACDTFIVYIKDTYLALSFALTFVVVVIVVFHCSLSSEDLHNV